MMLLFWGKVPFFRVYCGPGKNNIGVGQARAKGWISAGLLESLLNWLGVM